MRKVLVIDDDPVVLDNLRLLLEFQGFEVEIASDGKTGLNRAREKLPDGIICDLLMPGLNGVQVLKGLRQNPVTARIPVLFLSALHDRELFNELGEIEPLHFIPKPFTIASLKAGLRCLN